MWKESEDRMLSLLSPTSISSCKHTPTRESQRIYCSLWVCECKWKWVCFICSTIWNANVTSFLLAVLLTGWQVKKYKVCFSVAREIQLDFFMHVCVCRKKKKGNTIEKQNLIVCVKTFSSMWGVPVCVVPVFGEDPETLSEHFILAVCHG